MPGIPKPVAERLPLYLHYLQSPGGEEERTISSAAIARALRLGEVQVRKDLALVSGAGKPKVGYIRSELIQHISKALGICGTKKAVLVGAGRLGQALLYYGGFGEYGLSISAAFDTDPGKVTVHAAGKPVLPMAALPNYCQCHGIRIGIIAVPEAGAAQVYQALLDCGIKAVWNFAPCRLEPVEGVTVRNENMAAALAVLCAGLD